jgi:hypothetical protein
LITYYVCCAKSIFARNVKINKHLIIDVLSPFFLESFISWACTPDDIMGKDKINVFLNSKLTVNNGLDIFDL